MTCKWFASDWLTALSVTVIKPIKLTERLREREKEIEGTEPVPWSPCPGRHAPAELPDSHSADTAIEYRKKSRLVVRGGTWWPELSSWTRFTAAGLRQPVYGGPVHGSRGALSVFNCRAWAALLK